MRSAYSLLDKSVAIAKTSNAKAVHWDTAAMSANGMGSWNCYRVYFGSRGRGVAPQIDLGETVKPGRMVILCQKHGEPR